MVLYVDALILARADRPIHEYKRDRAKEIEMKDLGLMHYFLGLEVCHGERVSYRCPAAVYFPGGFQTVARRRLAGDRHAGTQSSRVAELQRILDMDRGRHCDVGRVCVRVDCLVEILWVSFGVKARGCSQCRGVGVGGVGKGRRTASLPMARAIEVWMD